MKKGLFREEAQGSSGVGGSWMDGTSVPGLGVGHAAGGSRAGRGGQCFVLPLPDALQGEEAVHVLPGGGGNQPGDGAPGLEGDAGQSRFGPSTGPRSRIPGRVTRLERTAMECRIWSKIKEGTSIGRSLLGYIIGI